ncbi:PREDICTED: granzyme H-like [Elephantulus edwardii]|uniref:granzyme H-like n=1 Tax=Elephantulus edwardii TaxID=28737 RepID=UPI0003F0AFBA|nr:PREDICTED: granzyme H-like [Elephantulus edwardii]
MQPLLLLLAFHLLPGAIAEEIIGGHEAQPHSRPYMAFVVLRRDGMWKRCSGFLVEEDIVLTAAHCWGSPMSVILGAHDIGLQEKTQQEIPVNKAIPHPKYNNVSLKNDIMILQMNTKAQLTAAVGLLSLPGESDHVRPGQMCSVAGWGRISENETTSKLHELVLIIQGDFQCERHVLDYDKTTELCAGDPQKQMCPSLNFVSCDEFHWTVASTGALVDLYNPHNRYQAVVGVNIPVTTHEPTYFLLDRNKCWEQEETKKEAGLK